MPGGGGRTRRNSRTGFHREVCRPLKKDPGKASCNDWTKTRNGKSRQEEDQDKRLRSCVRLKVAPVSSSVCEENAGATPVYVLNRLFL